MLPSWAVRALLLQADVNVEINPLANVAGSAVGSFLTTPWDRSSTGF
ncbi:MAG: hypothetical protein ABEJ40_09310 [Haloarculaceae archaeon]